MRKKYPRTYHLPFSEGVQSDDKIITSLSELENKEVVITLKYDGEATTMYSDDYMHARSIDSNYNWTRSVAKRIHSVIRHDIPEGYRLCLENCYAKHSIFYPDNYLDGYVYLLSTWNDENECLSWDETTVFAQLFDLPQPKELYRGIFDINKIKQIVGSLDTNIEEGIVVRITDKFKYEDFSKVVTKWVRKGHVQTDDFWLKNAIPNGLPKQPTKPNFLSFNTKKKVDRSSP